jgi:hypothetical protein
MIFLTLTLKVSISVAIKVWVFREREMVGDEGGDGRREVNVGVLLRACHQRVYISVCVCVCLYILYVKFQNCIFRYEV